MMVHEAVPGSSRIEARPVQGILPMNVEEQGDLRLYTMILPFTPPSIGSSGRNARFFGSLILSAEPCEAGTGRLDRNLCREPPSMPALSTR